MITADIVVAGGGHNSLITAAYLAKAGFECVVLDAGSRFGGGVASEEILLPGYMIDTCSTGHTLIRANPLIRDDELGLVARYGLKYVEPDPVAHVAFPDGEHFTMWLDLDATCAELARFSQRDADSYRRLIAEYDEVKKPVGGLPFRPIGKGPSTEELLMSLPRAGTWMRRCMMSARDVILREFEEPHVRAFMAWVASQTAVPIDGAGTGLLAYQIISGRQVSSWSIPIGGSGVLVDALVGFLSDHGASFHADTMVSGLILEDGSCVGVRSTSGKEFRARHAVVSTIHIKHLLGMAPRESWGEDFVYGVETYKVGVPLFASYFTSTEAPIFSTGGGGQSAVSAGVAGWIDEIVEDGRRASDGIYSDVDSWLLVATPTLVDPGRSPEGTHTVKFISFNSYDVDGQGPGAWDQMKDRHLERQLEYVGRFAPNFTEDVITARLAKSPLDIERGNPHMIRGAPHGGDRRIAFSGSQRPVPGWAGHRMPIPGLYQTGGTTHPGGSITGAPGRNAAWILLEDLGSDPGEVMGLG